MKRQSLKHYHDLLNIFKSKKSDAENVISKQTIAIILGKVKTKFKQIIGKIDLNTLIMNVEQARVDTFRLWPSDNPAATRLARNGFFATGNGFEIQCHWCSIRINEWTDADQVYISPPPSSINRVDLNANH